MQSLRRFHDTGEHFPNHPNALKYAITMVVALFGLFHPLPKFLGTSSFFHDLDKPQAIFLGQGHGEG